MIVRITIVFCFILLYQWASAQTCYDYPCVIEKVKVAIENSDYNTAFANLESASKYPKSNPEEISQLRKRLFDKINQEKIRAQDAELKTRQALQNLQAQTQRAETAEADVDRLAQERAQQEELEKIRIENDSIVAQNRRLALSLRDNDPSLALNMLRFNLDNFPDDDPSRAFYNEIYQRIQNEIACIASFKGGYKDYRGIHSVAISLDGNRCFLAREDRIILWEVKEDNHRTIIEDTIIGEIKVDSLGEKLLYVNGSEKLIFIDLNEQRKTIFQDLPLLEKEQKIDYWDLNPFRREEDIPLAGLSKDTTGKIIYVLDVGEEIKFIENIDKKYYWPIKSYEIESGGNFGIIAYEEAVYKWDLNQNLVFKYFGTHNGSIQSLAVSTKSPFALTGGETGIARLWRTNRISIPIQAYLGHLDQIYEVAISPYGDICATLSKDNTMKWWEVERGTQIKNIAFEDIKEAPANIKFTPDGQFLLIPGAGSVYTFDPETFEEIALPPDPTLIYDLKGEISKYIELTSPYAISNNNILSIGADGRPRIFQVKRLGHCPFGPCQGYTSNNKELEQKGVKARKELFNLTEIEGKQ